LSTTKYKFMFHYFFQVNIFLIDAHRASTCLVILIVPKETERYGNISWKK